MVDGASTPMVRERGKGRCDPGSYPFVTPTSNRWPTGPGFRRHTLPGLWPRPGCSLPLVPRSPRSLPVLVSGSTDVRSGVALSAREGVVIVSRQRCFVAVLCEGTSGVPVVWIGALQAFRLRPAGGLPRRVAPLSRPPGVPAPILPIFSCQIRPLPPPELWWCIPVSRFPSVWGGWLVR